MDKTGADLQNELKSLDKTSSEITEQIVELAFKNSNEVGNEVANLQNAYIDFRINGVTERFSSKEDIAKDLVSILLRILLLLVHCRDYRLHTNDFRLFLWRFNGLRFPSRFSRCHLRRNLYQRPS